MIRTPVVALMIAELAEFSIATCRRVFAEGRHCHERLCVQAVFWPSANLRQVAKTQEWTYARPRLAQTAMRHPVTPAGGDAGNQTPTRFHRQM